MILSITKILESNKISKQYIKNQDQQISVWDLVYFYLFLVITLPIYKDMHMQKISLLTYRRLDTSLGR
uniref:Uncharacterized protein n=1 Tax=Glossina pallidipes TaxID=7398 RepID=A0A1B0AIY5_GLOPL